MSLENAESAFKEAEVRPVYLKIREDLLAAMEREGFHRLPSERELCRSYGVCRPTVAKALSYFIEKGLIVRRPGKGSFLRRAVGEGSARNSLSLKIVVRNDWRNWEGDSYFGQAVQGVFEAASDVKAKVSIDRFDDALLYSLLGDESVASVWLSPESKEVEAMKALAAADRSVVAVNRAVEFPGVRWVASDHASDGEALASSLLKRGRKSFAYVCSDSDALLFDVRSKGVERALAGSGRPCVLSLFPGGPGWQAGFEACLDGLLSSAGAPDALIVNNARLLAFALAPLERRGLLRGRDIDLATFDEGSDAARLGVPAIRQRVMALGVEAARLALNLATASNRLMIKGELLA